MKNKLFYTEEYKNIQGRIKEFLNSQSDFLSTLTASSPRATGDAIQELLADNFKDILGCYVKEYSSTFARRAMADLAFSDDDGFYYVVDIKTYRVDTRFNMPNLTSVERLARFYEDDKNYFMILMVSYHIDGTSARVEETYFVPIKFLSWDCLTIGALGWGQIQIANSNRIIISPQSRKRCMIGLCDILFEFYPTEIGKIKERIEYFKKVKAQWITKEN